MGPKIDPNLTQNARRTPAEPETILGRPGGAFWDHFEVSWGAFWDRIFDIFMIFF